MSVFQSIIDAARAERTQQRVMVFAAEGTGRTRALGTIAHLRVSLSEGTVVSQTLRALLGEAAQGDDDVVLKALAAAPVMAGLDSDRAAVACELLASLLGIRRSTFRTAKLDEDSRREGALLELARWVVDRAATEPFVIAFDDVHLADDEGVAFLEALSQREEPAPLVLVVSADLDVRRHRAPFAAKREAWEHAGRWRRIDLKPPPPAELVKALIEAGADAEAAAAFVELARGNPALAFGQWRATVAGVARADLPTSLDALRLQQVRALGVEVLRAVSTLAVVGGVAPLAALSSVSPGLPAAMSRAAPFVTVRREGVWEVARLTDPRLPEALATVLPAGEVLGARLSAGAWAAQALEATQPADFPRVASFLVPLATPALDGPTASFWDEAWASTRGGRSESGAGFEAALRNASGVRRLVLVRRLADLKLFLGLPDDAIALISAASRGAAGPRQTFPEHAVGKVLGAQGGSVLDRWEVVSTDEALVALDLVRAECLSFLVKKDETQRAYAELEKRLLKLPQSPVASHLWIRFAKGWSWFLCEIIGKASEAMRVCALVRRQVSDGALAADEDAIAFVRAEEIATCSLGEFTRAKALTEEHIALAERAGRLRDACLGWNARAIVHYGQGELQQARKAFERSLELARSTGWLRREAITLHNLTLVLTELGEYELGAQFETTYARLSVLIGNHAAKAEAPLVLAAIDLARGRLKEAEAHITAARKAAEANGWNMLIAWSRALTGRLRLYRYKTSGDVLDVTRAKNDLLAALEIIEETHLAWSEELDPAEVFTDYAMALKWSGQAVQARKVVTEAMTKLPAENLLSRQQLEVARSVLSDIPAESALGWFDQNHFKRRAAFWRRA